MCGNKETCVKDLRERVMVGDFSGPLADYIGWVAWFSRRLQRQKNYKFKACHSIPLQTCLIKAGKLELQLHASFVALA